MVPFASHALRGLQFYATVLSLCFCNIPHAAICAQIENRKADFDSLAKAANAALAKKELDTAQDLYRKALDLNPEWALGWQNYGVLKAERKDFRSAQSAFGNLVRCQPTRADNWALLGITEFRLEQYDPAFNHFVRARSLPFDDLNLRRQAEFHFAQIMILRKDFDSAQKILGWLHRRRMKDPDLPQACGLAAMRISALPGSSDPATRQVLEETGRIVLLAFDGKSEEAGAAFEPLIRAHAELPGLYYAYGSFLAQEGLYDAAYSALYKGLELSPKDPFFILQLAAVEMQRNRNPEALGFARQASELAPDLFAGHLIEGKILLQQSRTEEAINKLELAAKLAPESPQVHVALLNAYLKARRTADVAREKAILKRLDDTQTAAVSGPSFSKQPDVETAEP